MTRTQYFTATSIDGFIADQHNSLDWLFEADSGKETDSGTEGGDAADGDPVARFLTGVGAMAMGATTYEWMLDHEKMLENPDKWREYYDTTPAWVFTHRSLPAIPGATLHFVADDVAPVHEAMVAAAGDRNVWLVGGGDLVGQFADRGLLDDIILGVAPVTLGAGAPLLPRRLTSRSLTLRSVAQERQFAYLTYEVTTPTP